jgi:hydrogenase/urease accessory protein HupE
LVHAHLVTTGLGPLYDGIGHFVLTPEDWVVVLALALFAGLRGAQAGRAVIFLLPLAWMIGGFIGTVVGLEFALPISALSFMLLGIFIVADLKFPHSVLGALAILIGLAHGYMNGVAMKQGPGMLGIIGVAATIFVATALFSSLVVSLKKPWTRIVVRVAGSWVAASGLLLLGWTLRPGA